MKYNYDQTLIHTDRMGLQLGVGDLVWYMNARGSTVSFNALVVLGETNKKVRLGTLGAWIWDDVTQKGYRDPRVFDTMLVNPTSILLSWPRMWPNPRKAEQDALKSGDYDVHKPTN